MAALTFWATLTATEGRTVDTEWEAFFARMDSLGQAPFRGQLEHPGWSPIRAEPPLRADANVVALSALVLDYDGTHTLEDAFDLWKPFYGYMHTTRRHTPAVHRFRVILPLSREITPKEHALLWQFVVTTSNHHVDLKTKDPSRFWYLPGGGESFTSSRLPGGMLDPEPMLVAARELAEEPPPVATRIHPNADTRADKYAMSALEKACADARTAAKGERNNKLFVAASTAGNFIAAGLLDEGFAHDCLEDAARAAGLSRFEARKTIRSGIAKGKRSPRQVPQDERGEGPRYRAPPAGHPPPPSDKGGPAAAPGAEGAPDAGPSSPSTEPHRLEKYWKTIGEWGFLDRPAPAQRWVLMRPDTESNEMANPVGLLPRSKLGFLLAEGETGKSFALIQLALSVATGRKWLDYFIVPEPGRVLLMLGEENDEDTHRRIEQLVATMRLTDQQLDAVRKNVVLMPLAAELTPLAEKAETRTVETDELRFYRRKLEEAGDEWTLIIIDPLSRFSADETEVDNAQATRFIQIAESLCKVPGRPSVLFSHHTRKSARGADAAEPSTADARGASGVTDGGRWCANLVKKDDGVSFTMTKNNYAPAYRETLYLERAYGGYLRVQSEATRRRTEYERDVGARQKILDALTKEPGLSKNALRSRVQMKATTLRALIDEMERDGDIIQKPRWCYRVGEDNSHA